jgi:hypothetical protein
VPRCDFRVQPRDRFTDDRQLLSDRVAKRLVGHELGLGAPRDSFAIQSSASRMSFKRC